MSNETLASKNQRIADYIAEITAVSLHSANPPTTANEISGGSPAYARVAPNYVANTGAGTADLGSGGITFNVPGGGTSVAAYGLWKGTNFFNGGQIGSTAEVYANGQGTFNLTSAPLQAV